MENGQWFCGQSSDILHSAFCILPWKGVLPVGATTARMRVAVTLMVAL
jgi:hypothetical protein